ncbi:MAG: ABC transporter permease [Desulfurococcaceae archaeon]|nr:ABC transporter permease [Desulfurococcaceae archaeon]
MKKLLRNELLRIFLSSSISKIGIIFLAIMIIASAYVVMFMPLDFGLRYWNNPTFWADYPKLVPPEWVNIFLGNKLLRHTILITEKPTLSLEDTKQYILTYSHDTDQLPQTIVFKLNNITFTYTPIIELSVRRPDGRVINLLVIQPLTSGVSERVDLSGRLEVAVALSRFLKDEFNVSISATEVIQRKLEFKILMGTPVISNGYVDFKTLRGNYMFNVFLKSDDPTARIGSVEVVIFGWCYGLMGTDHLGRDLSQALLYGFPVALLIGVVTSVITAVVGALAGVVSGYYGGIVDEVIQRLCDVLNNIPLLPLLIFFMFVIRMNEELRRTVSPLAVIIIVLVVFSWAGIAIIVRSMVLSIKSQQFIEASVAVGASSIRIMFKHILPQVAPFIFAQMMFLTPSAILSEAALSLLGLSDPSIPTWGQILESAFANQAMYLGLWWWIVPPGLLIMYSAITFVFIAQGLEPIVEPRLRKV